MRQLSVFMENREGRLGEVLSVLKQNNINILSMSVADTSDYGLLRLIVDYPKKGKEALVKQGFSALLTEVLMLKIDDKVGSLEAFARILSEKEINVEYMYGSSLNDGKAYVFLKTASIEKAKKLLQDSGIEYIAEKE